MAKRPAVRHFAQATSADTSKMLCEVDAQRQHLLFVASKSRQTEPYRFPGELSSADELRDDTTKRLVQLLQGWVLNCGDLTFCSTILKLEDVDLGFDAVQQFAH